METKDKIKYKFNSLTPEILDENKEIYTEALDYAFENKNIKNIAITGIYGAGKSSIWKTYTNKKKLENIITISLGKYENNNDSDENNNKSDKTTNRIERQMINQIASQVDSKKIPLSRYKFKKDKNNKSIVIQVSLTTFFVISIILWTNKSYFPDIYQVLYKILLKNIPFLIKFKTYTPIPFYITCFLSFIIPIVYFLYNFYKKYEFNISKVSLKGAEASFENNKENDETVLDRDIKELVYILRNSDSNVIVFEDLDRYDDISIFTKLRELNSLLNSQISIENPNRIVRFVYMVKDGLFESTNRVKFFDFIVPIIPVIDSSNSENKLISLLSGLENKPDERIISKISLYIDDMRLLKNIVNEYTVYSNVVAIKELKLDCNKLFALIVLKNIFSNEFDLLQKDRGYIHSLFERKKHIIEDTKNKLNEELNEINKKIEFLKNIVSTNKFDYMASLIPTYIKVNDYIDYKNWGELLKEWSENPQEEKNFYIKSNIERITYENFIKRYIYIDDNMKKNLQSFENDKSIELENLKILSKNLKFDINKTHLKNLNELLFEMNDTERIEFFEYENNEITKNHYFPLIRFLLIEGLIDETYWHYKSCFYANTLTPNDMIYIKNILEKKEQDIFLEVQNVNKIIDRLNFEDFSSQYILNARILKECLNNENYKKYVLAITTAVDSYENMFSDLIEILNSYDSTSIRKYISLIFNNYSNLIFDLLKESKEKYKNLFDNILLSLYIQDNVSYDKLSKYNNIINSNEHILDFIEYENIEGKDLDNFYLNLAATKVEFENLSKSEPKEEIIKEVESIKAFKLNINNINYLVKKLLNIEPEQSNLISTIYKNKDILSSTVDYINDNFKEFIHMYIDYSADDVFSNDESEVLMILNSDLDKEYKLKYLDRSETTIINLDSIDNLDDNKEIITSLMNKNKLLFNLENINKLYNVFKTYSNKDFIDYINKNVSDKNIDYVLKGSNNLCDCLINNPLTSDELFDRIIKFVDNKIKIVNEDLSNERVTKLLNLHLIDLSDENINLIMTNHPNLIVLFIKQNDNTDIIDRILYDSSLSEKLNSELVYVLIENDISEENIIKIIDNLNINIYLRKVPFEKKSIIEFILDNRFSISEEFKIDIDYIINNFIEFPFKDKFIEKLINCRYFSLIEEISLYNLNQYFISYILTSKIHPDYIKIFIIKNKIRNLKNQNGNETEIIQYIKMVDVISNLSEIWEGKYPTLNNDYKKEIAKELEIYGFAKVRKGGKLMLKKNR